MRSRILGFKAKLTEFCRSCNVTMYHNESLKDTGDYGIWYELGEIRLIADGRTAEKVPELSVQIWTETECSELPDRFEDFFDSLEECLWENQTYADYDSDIGRYHYGWTVMLT